MFSAPGLVFGGTGGVGSHFHFLRARTHFRCYRGRRVQFSCFALPDSFSAVPRASGPDFMFYAPGLIFGGTEGVGSRFHVLRPQTRFRRYRGGRVPFSCFALPNSFSAVPSGSGPVFMFCAPGLVFGGTEGVGSRFHVLRARSHFRRYRGCRFPFSCFARLDPFSAVPGRRVPLSCFALPDSFSAVRRASGPVFMFSAPGLVFGGTEGVGSRFHVLRAGTHFSAVPRTWGPVFIFCAPGLIFGGTEGVGSRFHV
jgi:hypothetical protein